MKPHRYKPLQAYSDMARGREIRTTGKVGMKQALLIVDVQNTFSPPDWLVAGIHRLTAHMMSVSLIELHDEARTPFERQLGWKPASVDRSLVAADVKFVKHGYGPTRETIDFFRLQEVQRVLVCGVQTETCVLAAGFALFDAGLYPTLITDLTVGSSLDRSGRMGISLWKHHFRNTTTSEEILASIQAA